MPAKKGKKAATVKVGGVISKGDGTYFAKGDELPASCDIDGLKAKGFAE